MKAVSTKTAWTHTSPDRQHVNDGSLLADVVAAEVVRKGKAGVVSPNRQLDDSRCALVCTLVHTNARDHRRKSGPTSIK